jgi:hypothetical protein
MPNPVGVDLKLHIKGSGEFKTDGSTIQDADIGKIPILYYAYMTPPFLIIKKENANIS